MQTDYESIVNDKTDKRERVRSLFEKYFSASAFKESIEKVVGENL